jgi:hypothetical protein
MQIHCFEETLKNAPCSKIQHMSTETRSLNNTFLTFGIMHLQSFALNLSLRGRHSENPDRDCTFKKNAIFCHDLRVFE